ncbi:ABC transporter ATP-binding protein [Mycoplasmoides pneumoniae]|uniref:ABC transporter ATP-binding protein n=1 Tax=Mycoplasmoides pneumoniae TaxID=2104 RepID=UPI0006BA33D8|nr:ABC transporter ATP-binding protein [Mycoplasmoides pneumoniae]
MLSSCRAVTSMSRWSKHKKTKEVISMLSHNQKPNSWKILWRLIKSVQGRTSSKVLYVMVCAIFGILTGVTNSILLAQGLGFIFPTTNTETDGIQSVYLLVFAHNLPVMERLTIVCVTVVVAYILIFSFNVAQNYLGLKLYQEICALLRWKAYLKIQSMSTSFFDTQNNGDLMSRLTNDVYNINNLYAQVGGQTIQSLFILMTTATILFVLSPVIALISLTVLIALIALSFLFLKKARAAYAKVQNNLGDMSGYIEEVLSNHKVVHVLKLQEVMIDNFDKYNRPMVNPTIKANTYAVFIYSWFGFISNITYLASISIATAFSVNNIPSFGVSAINYSFMLSYIAALRQTALPLNQIFSLWNLIQLGIVSGERVFKILDLESPQKQATITKLPNIKGNIRFEKVAFGYSADKPILTGIDFSVKHDDIVAIVGPTGAGKSTIINLLMKFYKPFAGKIYMDNFEISEVSETAWREKISIVLQDPFLFSGTIKENIRMGRQDATDEEIIEACKVANAHDFIMRLPQGYNTFISNKTDYLSVGERQLLTIARAVIRNAPVLLLDEATSSIDVHSEKLIQQSIGRLMKDKTSFIISHRLSIIRNATLIIVINDGKVLEMGNHEQLMRQNGFYARLKRSAVK